MQINITKKHEFMTGWTAYDMTWKSEFPGVRNKTIQSVGVVTKDPFSTKILKAWASEKGYDLDAIFTNLDKGKEDCEKMKQFCKDFNEVYGKNIEAIKGDTKCYVRYTATINPNYKPLKTAFETIDVYTVEAIIEFKGNALKMQFPSQVCILTILTPILMMLTPSKRAGLSKSSLCLRANRQQRSCKDITFSFS